MMKVLVVEDDDFKSADIVKVFADTFPDVHIERAMSVTSALVAISKSTFGIVALDMSLPTFELTGPGGGGSPQGQGGLEVLRLAKRLKNSSPFVVITQYPDIEINGVDIPVGIAAKALRNSFDVNVIGCLIYEFDKSDWRSVLRDLITKIGH